MANVFATIETASCARASAPPQERVNNFREGKPGDPQKGWREAWKINATGLVEPYTVPPGQFTAKNTRASFERVTICKSSLRCVDSVDLKIALDCSPSQIARSQEGLQDYWIGLNSLG